MKFELLNGRHSNKTGNFVPGDIVESDHHLDKVFVNKFRRRLDIEQGIAIAPANTAPKAKKPAPVEAEAEAEQPEADTAKQPEAEQASALGNNVTQDFPNADEADLLVFEKEGAFNIAESDKQDVALNDKPLKNAKAVREFIKKFVG